MGWPTALPAVRAASGATARPAAPSPAPRSRGPRTLTWVMEPRYVMGLSEGTRVLGMPLVMLPPGTEPRDVPERHETQGVKGVCNSFPGDSAPADLQGPLRVSTQRTPCPSRGEPL